MDRKYNLKLDLQFRCNNSVMKFRQSDNKTSDFFMRITSGGELFNIDNAIVILAAIKPNKDTQCQFLEVKEGKIYADLNSNMKDQVGIYKAQALLIYEDERVSTDVIEYEVTEDNILNQLETTVSTTEEFTMIQQMLSRLSVIENSENLRVENENNRVEAEKLREEAIEKIKSDTTKLISDTKKEISDYKNAKDTAINDDLAKYKQDTTQSIEEYKSAKDTEINNTLGEYKTNTTKDIDTFKNTKSQELDDFKNTKNSEIDNYKKEKDLAINQYVENKNLALNEYVADKNKELDAYKTSKDKEIDQYKNTKDKLINNKITEVESAKQNIISTANNKISEMDQAKTNMQNSVNSKIEEADNRISELQNFESQLEQIENKNIEQDNRLKEVEYKNKVQDVYVSGLFNENNDKRLSIEGEGNSLKLEGSKEGLVEVEKVVGYTIKSIPINLKTNLPNVQGTKSWENINRVDNVNYWTTTATSSSEATNNLLSLNIWGGEISQGLVVGNTYTLVIYDCPKTSDYSHYLFRDNTLGLNYSAFKEDKLVFKAKGDGTVYGLYSVSKGVSNGTTVTMNFPKHWLILEGDYTNKPIPSEYFEGMQSSFEENLVTQEMVDSEEELAENLGKYKVEVKVRGKNLIDLSKVEQGSVTSTIPYEENNWRGYAKTSLIKVVAGKTYTSNKPYYNGVVVSTTDTRVLFYDINKQLITDDRGVKYTFTVPNNVHYIKISHKIGDDVTFNPTLLTNWTLEEGTQATPYEPYFSRTQTVYLNSPLLKGDEIVCKEDGLYHWHKMGKVVLDGSKDEDWILVTDSNNQLNRRFSATVKDMKLFNDYAKTPNILCDKLLVVTFSNLYNDDLDGVMSAWDKQTKLNIRTSKAKTLEEFKSWLQDNPITVVYELKEPYYEKISDNKLLLEIPNNATLSVESVIPCQNISATYTGNVPSVYALEETNANQDSLIDISLMATDEMYMMLEPILEMMPTTMNINERMVSKMVDMYVAMVIRGLKTIEEVPVRYRKEVQSILDKLEK